MKNEDDFWVSYTIDLHNLCSLLDGCFLDNTGSVADDINSFKNNLRLPVLRNTEYLKLIEAIRKCEIKEEDECLDDKTYCASAVSLRERYCLLIHLF